MYLLTDTATNATRTRQYNTFMRTVRTKLLIDVNMTRAKHIRSQNRHEFTNHNTIIVGALLCLNHKLVYERCVGLAWGLKGSVMIRYT